MNHAINLLPEKSPLEAQSRKKKQVTYVFITIGLIVLLLLWLVPYLFLQNVKREENNLLAAISTKEQTIKNLASVERLYRSVLSKAGIASVILQKKGELLNDINKVTGLSGSEITLSNVQLVDKDITLYLNTPDTQVLSSYLDTLEGKESAQMFKTLSITNLSLDTSGKYSIGINGELNDEK